MTAPGAVPPSRSRLRQTMLLVTVVSAAIALVLGLYLRRVPAEAAAGSAFSGPYHFELLEPSTSLGVATFNIHGGRDLSGVHSLHAAGEALSPGRWDLIALQEVRGHNPTTEGTQAEILGHMLTRNWLFAPTERRRGRDDFGNGMLSCVAVRKWERVPLQRDKGRGYRNYVVVHFDWQDKPVQCLATHIDSTGDRDAQLAHVIELWLAMPPPCILMGDLNARVDHPAIVRLIGTPGVAEAISKATNVPNAGLDWIFVRGFDVVSAGVKETEASDHPIVWANLKLSE